MTARPPFMSADPRPQQTSPSTRACSLPLAGTVSRCPASRMRRSRPTDVRATTLFPIRSTLSHFTADSSASTWSARAFSWWLGDAMSTRRATSERRSALTSGDVSCQHPVLAQDVVQAPFVMTLALGETSDDENAGHAELAAGELAGTGAADRHTPGRYDAPADLLAGLGVVDGDRWAEEDAGADDRPGAHARPLDDHAAAADHALVSDDHRRRLRRLEHPADSHPARQVDVGADLGARAHRRPRVHHGVGPHPGPDVDVARHEDDAPLEVGAPAGRRPGHDPHAGGGVTVLERNLVGVLEGAQLGRLHGRQPEQQEDGPLQPLVHD